MILEGLKKHKIKILGLGVIILISVFYISFFHSVQSSNLDNVSGYAWAGDWADLGGIDPSTNEYVFGSFIYDPPVQDLPYEETGGMGWLSFNCTSGGNCGNVDYGVNLDANNNLVGYAWSSNYGWLKFGGLSGFPTGGGTVAENAKWDPNTGEISGWARFCAVAGNPSTCNGPTIPNIKNGGWDGWVSLRGTNYGVSLSGNAFSGNAWGGDDNGNNVVGWIDFSQVSYNPVTGPTVTISADPSVVPTNSNTVLTWDGLNLVNDPVGCTASGGSTGDGWDGSLLPSPSGTFVTSALPAGNYTYTITCNGDPSGSAVASVNVSVGVQLVLNANPVVVYPPSYQTQIIWDTNPSGVSLVNCTPSSSPAVSAWDNLTGFSFPGSVSNIDVPSSPTSYTLTCFDGVGNEVTDTVYVNRGTLPESVELSSNGVIENPVGQGTYETTMTWTTVNIQANSCVASNDGGVSSWQGPKTNPISGTQIETGVEVPPTAPLFTTYTLTCTGLYSGDDLSVSIQLNENSGSLSSKVKPKFKEN